MISADRNSASNGDGGSPDESSPADSRRAMRRMRFFAAIMAGTTLAALAIVYLRASRDRAPRLTEASYQAAVARWETNGPASYNLDLELTGNRPGKIHVEVRGGEVTHMTRDGVEPKQKRTWDYWSVPGMFDTIGEELEMAKDPAKSFNAPGASQVAIWADFDPRFGYPKRYDRIVLGADFEAHWMVTRFETVDEPR